MTTDRPPLPFASQRLVFFALLFGMSLFAVVVAVLLQQADGKGLATAPIAVLDTIAIGLGASMASSAIGLRTVLKRAAMKVTGAARSHANFRATLIPLAMIEAGCLFGLMVWLLNGNAVPSLPVALVLLALAVALVPFSDPDAKPNP